MATKTKKEIRLELPSTSSVECRIREGRNKSEYDLTFFQNERQLKSFSISDSHLNQDKMVDILSDAGVEFFSFSAIFDVADLLIDTIRKEFQELLIIEEKTETDFETKDAIVEDESIILDSYDIAESEVKEETEVGKEISAEIGDKLLKKFEMPYSQSGFAAVYYCRDGKYAVILSQRDTSVIRKKFEKDTINQDDLVSMISESGIDFLSFSAIYDTAEEIEKIVLHPEEFIEKDVSEKPVKGVPREGFSDEILPETPEEEVLQEDIGVIDLSSLDVSEFTNAEDFDRFVERVKEFVKEGQPLPLKEVEIQKSGGVKCIILRKMDSWYLRFKKKDGTLSEIKKIKVDQDEIARSINNAIPQISFSYLYDASESIFQVIEQLTLRPMDDVILNVAVSHYTSVIEQYEANNDLKAAEKVTEVLFDRFKREKNTNGIIQFGNKLIFYLEERKKAAHAIKRRNELAEELLDIDVQKAYDFVLESLDVLAEQEKFLNAANLCGLILDHYLLDEENVDHLKNLLILARKQVDLYEKARLPVVMCENALRYAHFAIKMIGKIDTGKIGRGEAEELRNGIEYLLDKSFEAYDERKATFELLESLENTLMIFKESNYKVNYSKYVERFILSCETQDQKKKALDLAIETSRFLMDSENFAKACEFGNQAIKFFYEFSQIEEAVEFSLTIVNGLLTLKESNAASDYLKFVENLIEKAYENDEVSRIEKQLALGDLFGKLGMQDRSKSYIQKALQSIKDQKKREKIVLDYVSELLSKNAVLTAQEMVNLELSRLLTDKKIEDVINFCTSFIQRLEEHKQFTMGFEYMKYIGNLMIQADHTDYKVLQSFIKALSDSNEVDKAAFMVDQLVALQLKKKDYTRAIDSMGRFLEYLLEKTNRYDIVQTFIHKTSEAYHGMGDPEGAVERLIGFQKQLLDHSLELAQRITDMILKELEQKEDFKGSINVVTRLIDKQLELKNFQDAYIYCVQSARYYEKLDDIEAVIKYLEKMRNKFVEYEQYEDANRMTDLIIRFGRSHKQYKLAINAVKNYSKTAMDIEDAETAAKFALEVSSLLEEEKKSDKAIEYLQIVFDRIYPLDKSTSLQIFQKILEIRSLTESFKKICKSYLEPLLSSHPDNQLIEKIKEILKPPMDEFSQFAEKIYDQIIEKGEISDDQAESLIRFTVSVYNESMGNEGDRLANKYAQKMLEIEKVIFASRLMTIVLDNTTGSLSEVIPISFKFVKELVNKSLLEDAREYTDRVIDMITVKKKLGNEGRLIAAKLTEKFAGYVATVNPDLASEYAYQAADYYRQSNDFKNVINVFINLADKFTTMTHSIRILNRGIYVCRKYKAFQYEAKLLTNLTRFLIKSHDENAFSSFQHTLEKYEELQDLDELLNVVILLIESGIESNNMKIAFTYLDYLTRLSSMVNQPGIIGGILLFLLRDAENINDEEKIQLINNYFKELGLKAKKYKKEYESLVQRRKAYLEERLEPESISELEHPFEPKELIEQKTFTQPEVVPELEINIVETSEIVPPPDTVPIVEPTPGILEERSDEEVVNVIKRFEQEEESSIAIPSLEGLETQEEIPFETLEEDIETKMESEPEITKYQPKVPQDGFTGREMLEIPSHEEKGSLKTALSDDEIATLFSFKESPLDDTTIDEDISSKEVPLELDESPSAVEVTGEKRVSLSNDEAESLFTLEEEAPRGMAEITGEDEWEIDAFGRLWRKGTIPSSMEEESQVEDIHDKTPDLSPLEKILHKEEVAEAVETSIETPSIDEAKEVLKEQSELNILEEALRETQSIIEKKKSIDSELSPLKDNLFDQKMPESFSSVVSSIAEDEESDPYMVPKVAYEEISKEVPSSESQVKPPDLAELFSDALAELGGISGEKGETPVKKKGKK